MRENPLNKKKIGIVIRTVSYLRWYCSMFQIFETFRTAYEDWIVVFGVSNAKYLAFDTPDENAFRILLMRMRAHNKLILKNIYEIF